MSPEVRSTIPDVRAMRPQRLANRIMLDPARAISDMITDLHTFPRQGQSRLAVLEGSENSLVRVTSTSRFNMLQLTLSVGKGSVQRFMSACSQSQAADGIVGQMVSGSQELSVTILREGRRVRISAQIGENRAARVDPKVFATLYTSLSPLPEGMRQARALQGKQGKNEIVLWGGKRQRKIKRKRQENDHTRPYEPFRRQ